MVTHKIKWKCFALLLLIVTTAKAVPGLTVITLDNTEQQFTLSQIGKITFEGNTMYLYDHDNSVLGYNTLDQVGKIVVVEDGTLYKTWKDIKSFEGASQGVRITLSQNNTFSYSVGQMGENGMEWYNYGSGTFLRQGNLILLCVTSGTGFYLPTCLVYNNGKLYGGFGVYGSYELQ